MGIRENRKEREPFHEYWKAKEGVHPAVKEFMIEINNPHGEYFKAAYYSYNKGSNVKARLAEGIAARYAIDPQMLLDAHIDQVGHCLNFGSADFLRS